METKYCKYCNDTKDIDSFGFYKKKRVSGEVVTHRNSKCNDCKREQKKEWTKNNREKINKYAKKYWSDKLERKREIGRNYYKNNSQKLKYYQKKQREECERMETCDNCGNEFKEYRIGMRFCSHKCFSDNSKEARTGEGNPSYRNGFYTKENKRKGVIHKDYDFYKKSKELKKEIIDIAGYMHCQHCNTNNSLRWETHHLVYRSEKVKHKNLHDKRNLIVCCIKCHNEFHKHKHEMRAKYIEERNLTELFGNDILPLRPIDEQN